MAGRKSLEDRLAALHAVRDDPAAGAPVIVRELESKQGLAVAAAARLVKELELAEHVPRLAPAFFRLVEREDPNCAGKLAVTEALLHHEADAADVYLRGVTLVQWEPVWGGRVDVGAPLRALAAAGLARLAHPDAPAYLAQLLADPEPAARSGAAAAFGDLGRPDTAGPILRFKVLTGDSHADVLRECMTSLLHLDFTGARPFVEAQLGLDPERAEVAALALGSTRRAETLPALVAWHESLLVRDRRAALVAIAMLRSDEAIAFLLGRLGAGAPESEDAMRALAIYKHDPRIMDRVDATLTRPQRARWRELLEG